MYYLLGRGRFRGRWIEDVTKCPDDFEPCHGEIIATPPPYPIEYQLRPMDATNDDEGPHMPAYLKWSYWSLLRDDLVQALREAGVDNLQTFDAIVHDPDNGQSYTNYKAFNLAGLVAAADLAKSQGESLTGGPPLVDVFFTKLVLDESRTHNVLMFRMAESLSSVMVHQSVKDYLEQNFPAHKDLEFYPHNTVAIG